MKHPVIDQGTILAMPKWADPENTFLMQIHDRVNNLWSVSVYEGLVEYKDLLTEGQIRNLVHKLHLNYSQLRGGYE